MKKITFLMLFFICSTLIFAQVRTIQNITPTNKNIGVSVSTNKAVGDTLMYFDGSGFMVNPTDQAGFNMSNEDIDGLTPNAALTGYTSKWMGFYSKTATDFLNPQDIARDTAFFIGATSWFTAAGQSDDWFEFGPITVPATGAKLKWAVKTDTWVDGYKVWASATGMVNYTDFTGNPLYSRADVHPSTQPAIDTVWTYYTVDIPASYNGGPVYIGFQHYAFDMDMLMLDEMTLTEAVISGVENNNNGVSVSQNFPNPVQNSTLVSYQLAQNANVNVEVSDITGRLVMSMNQGYKAAGSHQFTIDAANLPSGSYFYTLTAGENKTTKKMVVIK